MGAGAGETGAGDGGGSGPNGATWAATSFAALHGVDAPRHRRQVEAAT